MFKIINKIKLAEQITQLDIQAPLIANKARAGQFVMVIPHEKGERIPLTLANWDKSGGTITIIFQGVGASTLKLSRKNVVDSIAHILGPLGHPTAAENKGKVICIGGGVGIAEIYPVSKAFKQAGNYVIGIIGARSKDLLILEKEMKQACDELHVTTDDGSYGRKGFVTDVLNETLSNKSDSRQAGLVYAIGPVVMMKAVAQLTKTFNVKTTVSLNPIMVDATGMCGACRCSVGNETKFACVDGPEFDAHQVDFQQLVKRINQFQEQEQKSRDAL